MKSIDHDWVEDDLLDDEDEDALQDRYLTFCLAGNEYGITIEHVVEIVPLQPITEVPNMPPHVRGVINLRGRVIPVIDLRARLHFAERAYDDRTCIIVVHLRDEDVGMIVDRVADVLAIPAATIAPIPLLGEGTADRFLLGLGKLDGQVKVLLDADLLIFADHLPSLAGLAAAAGLTPDKEPFV